MSKDNFDLDNLFKKLDKLGGLNALSELLNNPDINKINDENLPDLNEIQKVLNALENPNDLDENQIIEIDNIISEWEKNDEIFNNLNKKNVNYSSNNKIGNIIKDLKKAGEYKKRQDLNKKDFISKEDKKLLFEQLITGMKLKAESNSKISEKEKKMNKLMNILKNKIPNKNENEFQDDPDFNSKYKTYTLERKYEPKDVMRFDNSKNIPEGYPIIKEEIIQDGNKKIRKYEKKNNYQDGNTYKESHVKIVEETDNGGNNNIKSDYFKDIHDNFEEDEKEFEKLNKRQYNYNTYNPGRDTFHESHYEKVVKETNNNIPQSNYYKSQNTFDKIEDDFDDFDTDYKINKNVFKTYNPNNNTKFTARPIEREEIINDGNKKIKKYEKKQASNDGNTYKESHVKIVEETDNGGNNNIKSDYFKDINDNFEEDEKEFEKLNKRQYNYNTYNPNMKNSGPIVREEIINDGNKKIRKFERKESKNNGDTIHESHYEEVVEGNNNNIPQSNYYKTQKMYKSNKVQNNYFDQKFNDLMDSNLDKINDHFDDDDFEKEVQKLENQFNNDFNNNLITIIIVQKLIQKFIKKHIIIIIII